MKSAFENPLARGARPGYPAAIERIKNQTRAFLVLDDASTVAVSELACRDPGCPGVETIIAILAEGKQTRTVRFHKAIPDIGEKDLLDALHALAFAYLRRAATGAKAPTIR